MMKVETKKNSFQCCGKSARCKKGYNKACKKCTFSNIKATFIIWLRQYCTGPDLKVDGDMLVAKADYFSKEFGCESSEMTSGWIHRCRKRYGMGEILKSSEAGGVDTEV